MKKFILIFFIFISVEIFPQNTVIKNEIIFDVFGKSKQNSKVENLKSNSLDSLIGICVDEINSDSLKNTMQQLQNFGTRFMLAPNRKEIALWLQNKFISVGCINIEIDSFLTTTNWTINSSHHYDTTTWQYNVIATIPGLYNPEFTYIVGGHYDCVTYDDPMNFAPGADDDASGVAATIEIARVINKIGIIPGATIKLISFAAEEGMIYHTDEYGSLHYVKNAINNNEKIICFITNDMIANSSTSSDWKIDINNHDNNHWLTKLAIEICLNYTSLTPYNNYQGNAGADDIPFWEVGISTLWIMEHNLSPNYHSNTDVVDSCNIDYCTEVTKISAGIIIKAANSPLNIENYFIVNPGNGHSLIPTWKANQESDLAGYKVYVGRSTGIYDTVILTTDTSIVVNNLDKDSTYYIGVSAFNADGYENSIIEKSDSPVIVSLDNGILIIKDSKGGFYDPTEQQIDVFYNQICSGFDHTQFDATTTDKISLGLVGQYSSILWHINNYNWTSPILKKSTDVLRNFLKLGGHILFTVYCPSKSFINSTGFPATFKEGSFLYDCAKINSIDYKFNTWFSGAKPAALGLDSIYVDSIKMPAFDFQLPFIEALSPSPEGEVIYLYDSKYDSTSTQGSYKNKAVGIENKGIKKNIITLSFPLYYMKIKQAKEFVYHVMYNKFNENFFGIDENSMQNNNICIIVYPNPANDFVNISYYLDKTEFVSIKLIDFTGKEIKTITNCRQNRGLKKVSFNILELESGIYLYEIQVGRKIYSGKITIVK